MIKTINSDFVELEANELECTDGGVAPVIIAAAKIVAEAAVAGFIVKAVGDIINN